MLVVNKVESCSQHFIDKIKSNYSGVVDIAFVSAHNGSGLQQLVDRIGGQTVCLAGQSGVGKSSLLNALAPESLATTQGLSVKIERGKNTTRKTQLYKLNGGFIVDTPGFSLLDIDVNSADLQLYYPDFCQYMDKCKYHMCTHTAEPDCAVKDALNHGLLNAERYSRYVKIREELFLKEKHNFEDSYQSSILSADFPNWAQAKKTRKCAQIMIHCDVMTAVRFFGMKAVPTYAKNETFR